MPEQNRIGVIAYGSTNFVAWHNASNIGSGAAWHIERLSEITELRDNEWKLSSVLCLPGWEQLHDAQAIRMAAEALVVPLPRRGREAAPVMVDTTAPTTVSIAVRPDVEAWRGEVHGEWTLREEATRPAVQSISRDECIAYLRDRFPHAFAPRAMDMAQTPDLIMLRGLSIRAEAARLNSRTSDERSYRDQITALVQRLNERVSAPATPIGGWVNTTDEARIRPAETEEAVALVMGRTIPAMRQLRNTPPPVADVLADAMTRAREAIERENQTRRAQGILDRVREVNARRGRFTGGGISDDE